MSDAAELKGKRGLRRLINALCYSRNGIAAAWRNEAAFRQEILLAVVDKASPEKSELAKRAKDMGSAAVLLSLVNAAAVWACLLWG